MTLKRSQERQRDAEAQQIASYLMLYYMPLDPAKHSRGKELLRTPNNKPQEVTKNIEVDGSHQWHNNIFEVTN
jgi:hypothetical protein